MFLSRFMQCPDAAPPSTAPSFEPHECDPERARSLRDAAAAQEIDAFEQRLRNYLDQPEGRFETWLAHRRVRLSR